MLRTRGQHATIYYPQSTKDLRRCCRGTWWGNRASSYDINTSALYIIVPHTAAYLGQRYWLNVTHASHQQGQSEHLMDDRNQPVADWAWWLRMYPEVSQFIPHDLKDHTLIETPGLKLVYASTRMQGACLGIDRTGFYIIYLEQVVIPIEFSEHSIMMQDHPQQKVVAQSLTNYLSNPVRNRRFDDLLANRYQLTQLIRLFAQAGTYPQQPWHPDVLSAVSHIKYEEAVEMYMFQLQCLFLVSPDFAAANPFSDYSDIFEQLAVMA